MTSVLCTLALSGLLACSVTAPTPIEEPEEPSSCVSHDQASCLDSPDCTLILDSEESAYRCRQATAPCELSFRQAADTPETCEARAGCRFEPGRCYCPPDVNCICGGGPPPRCAWVDEVSKGSEANPS